MQTQEEKKPLDPIPSKTMVEQPLTEFTVPIWQPEVDVNEVSSIPPVVALVSNADDGGTTTAKNLSRRDRELQLLESIMGNPIVFMGEDDKEYVLLPNDGGRATGLKSKAMRDHLGAAVHAQGKHAVAQGAVDEFIHRLAGQARHCGDVRPVPVRVALHNGEVWLDLGGKSPRFVQASASGWCIKTSSPVAFRKSSQALELPLPVLGGSINELRALLNIPNDDDFILMAGWLIGALVDDGPCALLALQGQQGCGKSFAAKALKRLVDDSRSPLRTYPSDSETLFMVLRGVRVAAFDNLSRLTTAQSDDLCGVVNGTARSKRTLYTDDDEHLTWVQNPIIVNGIDQLAERPDLVSRTIVIELPPIADDARLTERELRARFEEARPRILGALLTAVCGVLKNMDSASELLGARMADFVSRVSGAEESLGWPKGSFARAYASSQKRAHRLSLDSDPLSQALLDLMSGFPAGVVVEHTATEWRRLLQFHWSDNRQSFPANAQTLSNRLRRLAPALRETGVRVDFDRNSDSKRTRVIAISIDQGGAS